MRKNYRRKNKKHVTTQSFPQLSIQDFETYCAITLDDMVKADRYTPGVDNYGAQPFSAAGLRDEGHGVIVHCKDGSSFILSIKPLDELGKA
jgi:hypothetical protein